MERKKTRLERAMSNDFANENPFENIDKNETLYQKRHDLINFFSKKIFSLA